MRVCELRRNPFDARRSNQVDRPSANFIVYFDTVTTLAASGSCALRCPTIPGTGF